MFRGTTVSLDQLLPEVHEATLAEVDHVLQFPLASVMAPAQVAYWERSKIDGFMSVEVEPDDGGEKVRMTQVHLTTGIFFMSSDVVTLVAAKMLRPWEHCLCCASERQSA
jgi:hypothetical protein